ncbi:MAG: hypothetical protein JWN16_2442 [Alphaproteobacteria bacterium]|nr:hypothetical protein [Alphaproteobacteria bacterium]
MRKALAGGFLLLAGAVALAQDVPAPPVSAEFVRLFSSHCLSKFPDALAQAAVDEKLEPLTAAQVASYLHSDPGKGWLIAAADGNYVLTEEDPPYHACAVRRYATAMMDGKPLFAAAKAFVASSGRSFGTPQSSRRMIGPGIVSNGLLFPVIGATGQPTGEAFMFFVVAYPATTKADGTDKPPFFDVRFVRQLYEKAV